MLRNQIVNSCPNCHSDKNIRCNLLHSGYHLILCIIHSVSYRQLWGFNIHILSLSDELFHLIFHMKFLNQSASNDRHNQTYNYICKRNLASKHTHEQHKRTKIYHRRRYEK